MLCFYEASAVYLIGNKRWKSLIVNLLLEDDTTNLLIILHGQSDISLSEIFLLHLLAEICK